LETAKGIKVSAENKNQNTFFFLKNISGGAGGSAAGN
jgi:hypothetical protein